MCLYVYARQTPLVVFMNKIVPELCGWRSSYSGGALAGEEVLRTRSIQKYMCEKNSTQHIERQSYT